MPARCMAWVQIRQLVVCVAAILSICFVKIRKLMERKVDRYSFKPLGRWTYQQMDMAMGES